MPSPFLPAARTSLAALLLTVCGCGPVAPEGADAAAPSRHALGAARLDQGPFTLVSDLAPGPVGSAPRELQPHGGWLYFVATDPSTGDSDVWRTDGTAPGTARVTRSPSLTVEHRARQLTFGAADRLYFVSCDSYEPCLLTSDGTPDGTRRVSSISSYDGLAVVDAGVVYADLLRSGGLEFYPVLNVANAEGTVAQELLTEDYQYIYLHGPLVPFGGRAVFSGQVGSAPEQLWVTDGTTAGTFPVTQLPASKLAGVKPVEGVGVLGARALFFTSGDEPVLTLRRTDGATSETVLELPKGVGFEPNLRVSDPVPFAGGLVYALGSTHLWFTDGTTAGTYPLADLQPSGATVVTLLRTVGNTLYFLGWDAGAGPALWALDASTRAAHRVKDLEAGNGGVGVEATAELHGSLYFVADTATFGRELWRSDGTEAGTVLVQDFQAGPGSGSGPGLAVLGQQLFVGAEGAEGSELRVSPETTLAALAEPRVSCESPSPVEVTSREGAIVEFPFPQASDVVATGTLPGSGTRFALGTSWVQGWAVNAAGVHATCGIRVDVVDTTPPALQCPELIEFESAGSELEVTSQMLLSRVTATDVGSEVILRSSLGTSARIAAERTMPVDFDAVDHSGNRSVCHSALRVHDTRGPVLWCPDRAWLTANTAEGVDSLLVLGHVTSFGVVLLDVAPAGVLAPGRTQVTVTGTSSTGATARCTFEVEVTVAGPVQPHPPVVGMPSSTPDARQLSDSELPGCTAAAGGLAPLLAALWLGPALRRRRRAAGAARA